MTFNFRAVLLLSTVLGLLVPVISAQTDHEPILADVLADTRRALVIEVILRSDGTAELLGSLVSNVPPGAIVGEPELLQVEYFDRNGQAVGSQNAWDPRWEFSWLGDEQETQQILPEAVGSFGIPFSSIITTVVFTDLQTEPPTELMVADVSAAVEQFCTESPDHPDCAGFEPSNSPPAPVDDSFTTDEDTVILFNVVSNDGDPDGNLDVTSVGVVAAPAAGLLTDNGSGSFSYAPGQDFHGADAFTYQICDTGPDGDPTTDGDDLCVNATVDLTVNPVNDPPVLGPLSDIGSSEGEIVYVVATFSDVDDDSGHTATIDFGDGGGPEGATVTGDTISASHAYGLFGEYTVTVAVLDDDGGSASDTLTVTVEGDPSGGDLEGPRTTLDQPDPVPVEMAVTVTALVDDRTTGGSTIVSAEYSTDGGATWQPMQAADSAFDSVAESASADLGPYAEPRVLDLCVRGADSAGNDGEPDCALLVLFDPEGGFVTGGGWIWVEGPPSGKATFGFVAKYDKKTKLPKGNTQFVFQSAEIDFHSDRYEWLVVNQGASRAQFKGDGLVNGGPAPNGDPYRFMLWAGDGEPDTFRIRIWWEEPDGTEHELFDNGAEQPIGGGSIVVHTAKGKK